MTRKWASPYAGRWVGPRGTDGGQWRPFAVVAETLMARFKKGKIRFLCKGYGELRSLELYLKSKYCKLLGESVGHLKTSKAAKPG